MPSPGASRAADALGVDVIQHCEVTGIRREGDRVTGWRRGPIAAAKIGMAVAGNTSRVAAMAGLNLPIESHVLQAFVTEGLKPLVDTVITFGAGHFYISQSDKGGLVFGGDLDGYNSYAQRGTLQMVEHVFAAGVAMMPCLSRLRVLRQWGGVMDMTMDGSPSSAARRLPGSISMAAGAMAASRRRPARAGVSPTRSPTTRPIASTRR